MAVENNSSRNSPDFKQEESIIQEYDAINNENNSAHDEGKMFIGGLNWETTDESLKSYFSQFGEIKDCVVMRDQNTGRSRGFGFLTFIDPSNVDKVLATDHQLDGKLIDPKRAIPREEQEKTEKIFVGGIAPEVSEEEFKEYFSQFGVVKDATLMVDRDTGRPRGFGFITFESSEPVEKAMARTDLSLQNKMVEVKRAMPKHKSQRINIYGGGLPSVGNAGIPSGNGTINGRYGSSYGIGGKDGGGSTGYSGMSGYNSGSYPGSYSGYNNYPNYGYPNSYPGGYHQYNAMTHAYYSSRYGAYNNNYGGGSNNAYGGPSNRGGGGGGGAGGGSYNHQQWYGGRDVYGSGAPSNGGGGNSNNRLNSGYRHSPTPMHEDNYNGRDYHQYAPNSTAYGRVGGGSRNGPPRSAYSNSMNAAGSAGAIYSSHSVRGQHNYHPYTR